MAGVKGRGGSEKMGAAAALRVQGCSLVLGLGFRL